MALAVFFVGANFSYIQAVQHSFFREEIFQVCGLWFGLALCVLGQRRKQSLFLYLGFFVFGLTLWDKIMFIAYIIGAFAVFFVFGRKSRDFIKDVFPSHYHALLAGMAFVCGAAPLVWFNVRHGFPTLKLISFRVFHFTEVNYDWNNSAVFANFIRRIHDFYLYIIGEVLFELETAGGVYVVLLTCAFVWGCVIVFGRRGDLGLKQRLRVLFVFYAVVLFLTCFIPNKHHPGHILVLVPFSGILCSLFLVHIARVRGLLFVPVLICGLWFNEQLDHFYSFSREYIQNGKMHGLLKGEPELLTVWLKSKDIKSVLCSDPVGYVLSSMAPELDMDFQDMGYCPSEREVIAQKIGDFISRASGQKAYMLICSGANFDYFSKVKKSAAQQGIEIKIVDLKVFRRKPTYAYVLCLVSAPEKRKAEGED